MNYQTRHLTATREIAHGDKFLKPGDTFEASEVDAEHYVRLGHAKVAVAETPAPAPAPAPRAPVRSGRRAPVEVAAPAEAPAPAPAPAEPPAPPAEPAPTPAEPTEQLMTLADVPHPDADTPTKE